MKHTKDSALAVAAAQGVDGLGSGDSADCAASAADDKAFFTLRAQLALKGHVLSRTRPEDGPVRYYTTRWGHARELDNLDQVSAFAEQVGAKHA
jgi:hypothetical protein